MNNRHNEWRKIAKKARRKRIRQAKAKVRDQKLSEEQQNLESSYQYQEWLKHQERLQKEDEEEERRRAAEREEQWQKNEAEAQIQWNELQRKLALARGEKIKQNIKIKLEWEKEQQRLKKLEETKRNELEEQRRIQHQHENELLDFLERGGDTPEHLKTLMETNPGKQVCPFFQKVSACRFFDGCSRNHIRPGISRTILISHFFSDISLEIKENEHGSDSNLEYEKEDTYKHYKEFFYDVVAELEKCGKIRNFRTCCNHEVHLRGNVYVEYYSTREALISYHKFNGRWYAGRQINVEFCTIESWKNAICGLFDRNRCPKGNSCNFLHVFKNPKHLYSANDKERVRHSNWKNKETFDKGWDEESPKRRDWRWSESPERVTDNNQDTQGYRSQKPRVKKKYAHDDKRKTSKRKTDSTNFSRKKSQLRRSKNRGSENYRKHRVDKKYRSRSSSNTTNRISSPDS